MSKQLSLVLFIMIWACSCSTDADTNAPAVKNTVLRYNQLLAEAYATMNMNPLREVATAEQAAKEYRHMAALGEAKIRMVSKLNTIEFSEITMHGDAAAAAVTKEAWTYTHHDTRTQKPVAAQRSVVYTLQYRLKKEHARWYVESLESLDDGRSGADRTR